MSAQSSADWDWMSNHFDKALHDLFPIDERYGVYVAYRSHRDLHTDVPEYSFAIGTEKSDTVSGLPRYLAAHVREAESVSLYDQMMALHRKSPNRSADDIEKDVHVKKLKLTEMNCPAIKAQFSKFQQLRLAPPQFDVDWYPEHLRLFLASVAAFYVLIYVAGGGGLPWKIKVRDYLAYVLISLGVVAIVILVAVYEVHKTR